MENVEKKCEEGCKEKCGACPGMMFMGAHGCHGGKCHHLLKIILKLIIIMMIFCFGFKLGVITGSVRGLQEESRISNRGGYGMMQGYRFNNPNVDFEFQNQRQQTPTQAPSKN